MEDHWRATDDRKIGLSQHRFFCECGNIITAPSASAYIEPGGIRHQWVCDSCHRAFETSIGPVEEAETCEPLPVGGSFRNLDDHRKSKWMMPKGRRDRWARP
jgi:hypothetical protein